MVIVDNIPKVGPTRQDKLKIVIDKLFSSFGDIVNTHYPKDEQENTKGFAFLEYKNHANAEEAVKMMNNHRLDKSHTFSVNLFSDFQKYSDIPEEWEPPKPQEYTVQTDLYTYLSEPDAHDQFCVVTESAPYSFQVQFWHNTQPEPTELLSRDRFTESSVCWSPLGTYIVTFHKQGVVLWGGASFVKINKFPHAGARIINFSPCENYLVTYSAAPANPKIIIWDIRTGQEKRSFIDIIGSGNFRWSKDDKYVARMTEGAIHIYETPSFYLMDMKSYKIPGIRDFSWSPTDNIIAYWVAEETEVPAKVTLIEIPRKREIRTKNLFNVADCKIHWQKSGDYLCVKVDRFSKSKKDKKLQQKIFQQKEETKFLGTFYNFEIFHMREKDIPVDSVEVKETIQAFAWEPVGSKFCIIHGEPSAANISFYEAKKGQKPVLIKKMEKKISTHLFWSPRGQFIVLANTQMGSFEFVDTNDFVMMNSGDHYRAASVEWDPTGRFVTTAIASTNAKEDQGYYLWSFQGRILKRVNSKNLIQFLWRPRPLSLLTEEQLKDIKKNLKKYYGQFESKDRMRMTRASKELLEKRSKLREQFTEYTAKRKEEWAKLKYRRLELRNSKSPL